MLGTTGSLIGIFVLLLFPCKLDLEVWITFILYENGWKRSIVTMTK